MTRETRFPRLCVCMLTGLLSTALSCSSDSDNDGSAREGTALGESVYVTSTVVLSDEGESSYVSLLDNLDPQKLELKAAREFGGWSSIAVHDEKLYVASGESPTLTQFEIGATGGWTTQGDIDFSETGAQYADSVFVADEKAYLFPQDAVVWDPKTLSITGEFELPPPEDRADGLEYSGLSTGRSLAKRGNRLYIATHWASWEDYSVSEDSLIVVVDTDEDRIIDMLPVACPYLDVASVADDGSVYFSNWVYSVGQTLLQDKRRACAVRLKPDEDKLDEDWKVTFADVTGGHEAAALRYVGDNKAVISVYQEGRVDFDDPEIEASAIGGAENWQTWMLDLDTREAKPIDGIGFNSGGTGLSRVDDRSFLMVPTSDYESTTVYEVSPDGAAEEAWTTKGWSTQLYQLR